ncbi:MAG: patatin-like phospholipase family protein [Planctomycetes bacterium]|nr:patatin-like phospholipase family protein [Planctomycetota bacterium]
MTRTLPTHEATITMSDHQERAGSAPARRQNGGSTAEESPAGPQVPPTRECDVVMKGGITSGVVYPGAICELARSFRLRSIGGTSAGAIAAACAAAAEHGRGRAGAGFELLAGLPERLGEKVAGRPRLLSLFQPSAATRPLFALLLGALRPRALKPARLYAALLVQGGLWSLVGSLPALGLLIWLLIDDRPIDWHGILGLVLMFLVGATAAALARQWRILVHHLPRQHFGICSGQGTDAAARPALTDWLHREIQALAALGPDDPPLSFRMLEERGIELQVITTCLTHGRPYGLPGLRRRFYFAPAEFRRLFPEAIVARLEAAGQKVVAEETKASRRLTHAFMHPRLPLPKDGDLPVLVAVRMSLSFPLLLGALPLWDFDWGGSGLGESEASRRRRAFRTWAKTERAAAAAFLRDPEIVQPGRPDGPVPERIWFSDGGISSNFPMHLFDAPLPSRPTIGLNLAYHQPGRRLPSDRVVLVSSASGGVDEVWTRLAGTEKPARESLGRFLASILNAMQNWTDGTLLKLPGYRDRFATIHLQADEGGLNLEMPAETIAGLAGHGAEAGRQLRERFLRIDGAPQELSWTHHRWTRFRSTLASFEEWLGALFEGLESRGEDEPDYEELLARGRDRHPGSYGMKGGQRELAAEVLARLAEIHQLIATSGHSLQGDAPRPRPLLRHTPRSNYLAPGADHPEEDPGSGTRTEGA